MKFIIFYKFLFLFQLAFADVIYQNRLGNTRIRHISRRFGLSNYDSSMVPVKFLIDFTHTKSGQEAVKRFLAVIGRQKTKNRRLAAYNKYFH